MGSGVRCLFWALVLISASAVREVRVVEGEGEGEGEKEKDFMAWVARVGERVRNVEKQRLSASSMQEMEMEINASRVIPNDDAGSSSNVVIVDQNGNGQYYSIQAAIDAVPWDNTNGVVIHANAGYYKEKVRIPQSKRFITLEGDGAGTTIIVGDDTAGSAGTLQDSATVGIDADYFIARAIGFQNYASPPEGYENRQAVALRISGDKASFYHCNFLGVQDTLYDDRGKHYFENCFIQGSVDFICGNGQSLYKGCTLQAISSGAFSAQRRNSPDEQTGFSFVECVITGSGRLFLGRAWGPYSRVVFLNSYMDDVIKPTAWYNWGEYGRENTVSYGEYKCSGPGSNRDGRVYWSHELSDAEAAPFQSLDFIDGTSWIQY